MWLNLGGSTSSPLKHVKDVHYDKLTGKRVDRKLAKTLISSHASWTLLDNSEFV